MYLKSLTVLGFKSFADKTTLNFLPGITAVVGPNGCGKSNVADSIRWVLGEQSAKALRGGEMADVIFNGTDRRKPLGMAEVSLTIGGVDEEHLRAAGVEIAYNEVTLTRRVFRDGVSEYFINKTACRLKDIQQLFMGTGVGRTSYSIMAQGHITQLLSSRPEDRRQVFEEAAGITKFKTQKKEALRKLESTEQNLLRVGDLVREVKRQIGSLQRQAGKARRYKQLMQELQHLETQLARHQFDVLQAEIRERQAASDKLRTEIELCSEAVLRGEAEVGELREQMTALEHRISERQQQSLELKGQIDWHGSRVEFNQERLRELEQQNARALSDIAQAEERRHAVETELNEVTQRLASATQSVEQLKATLSERQLSLQNLESDLRRRQEQLRELQVASMASAQHLTRLRNDVNTIDLQKQGNLVRLEKLSSEKVQLEEERLRLDERIREYAANVESEKLSVQTRKLSLEEQQLRLRELQQQISRVSHELDQTLQRQSAQRSRLHVLEQLQADYEGFSAGTLAALKQAPNLLGALIDKIRVPDEFIPAIEAALGHHLQLVLTEVPETAGKILLDLAAHKQGRASIAPLRWESNETPSPENRVDSAETGSSSDPAVTPAEIPANPGLSESPGAESLTVVSGTDAAPAGAAPLDSSVPEAVPIQPVSFPYPFALALVDCDATVRPLMARLLDRFLIVPDLESATAFWRANPGDYHLVTRQGEIISRQGVFTGGSIQNSGQAPGSLLGRKNQIAELQAQLAQTRTEADELGRQKGTWQSEQSALQASWQQAQTELRTQEVAIATRQGEFRALENAARILEQKIDTVVYEIQNLADRDRESAEKRQALQAQIHESEQREQNLQQQLEEANGMLEHLRQQRETAMAALGETKVALATEEQLARSFGQQAQSHQHRLEETSQLLEQRQAEIASLLERRARLESEIAESNVKAESLRHEREQVNAHIANLSQEKEGLDGGIETREAALREQRQRHSNLQEQRGAFEVELAQKQMAADNVRERIAQKYQVRIEDIRSECITITIADSGPPKIQTLTPEEMAAQGVATDWGAVAEQVVALQQRIDEMGPVNLVAIEEYEEAEQRYQFLNTQNEDLLAAKTQLIEAIQRINTQTREMFSETFARVRENFRSLFIEIFGGGNADLVLQNESDVLESGIDIIARPPGKQLKSITLLSGGEQTMTAVALLFAIYQVKPSPFCVLDELDAPLDESNINRFIAILKRFLVHSQFIIITHNKRTIGTADAIYGVTMQESGISKLVSVKFLKSAEESSGGNGNGNGHHDAPEKSEPAVSRLEPLPTPTSATPATDAAEAPRMPTAPAEESFEMVTAK